MASDFSAHDMDAFTMFCIKCGKAAGQIVNGKLQCTTADNVFGMSHLRALQRAKEMLAQQTLKQENQDDIG